MKEFLLKWLDQHWGVVCLFILFLFLSGGHAFMIHYNRSPEQLKWMEEMIFADFTVLIAKLKD